MREQIAAEFDKHITSLEAKAVELQVKNQTLVAAIECMTNKLDDLEQFDRRNNVRVHNPWPE